MYEQEASKEKKPFYKKWWFIAIVVFFITAAIATGGEDEETSQAQNDNNNSEENEPENTENNNDNSDNRENEENSEDDVNNANNNAGDENNEAVEEEEPETDENNNEEPVVEEEETEPETADYVSFGSGMFIVGDEIQPGLYRNGGSMTYWERLAGYSGELDDIISNGLPEGPAYVEIKESDEAFSSQGSGEWILIDDNYEGELLTEFGDGQYLVGVDIEPGKYRNDSASGGYWARLSGFDGELDNIISNDIIEGSVIVEISSSDYGFETTRSGTWTKIE
ncbi:hypothetical protein MM300_01710 [Evansella sp. LMS18]|uniref:hypothetical protein n=1 Tax=Evansella sp. LMS18 TaxID=2924033 RepID=UPI0020D1D69D|nr:hypothetical protein [Evansella sp. LMS18]UTR11075.1 hypothetical protein MM300_01710 [Evansella sp. LMS18]